MDKRNWKIKKESGITLVALVITVIVLLILAGVAISAIVGEDGIFSKAKSAAGKYNNAALNEAEIINAIMSGEWSQSPIAELPLEKLAADGNFDATMGVNAPDTSKLTKETTYYVTWKKVGPSYTEVFTTIPTMNWYNYNESKWANIMTTSTDGSLEAYWVWIPRFAYKLPESSTPKTIEVAFVKDNGTTVINPTTGAEEQAYYATDNVITTDGSGIYAKKTADAKDKWIIHPAFSFGNSAKSNENKQLTGIWVAKYEASSTNTTEANGGGNTTVLKVQVKANVTSWRYITAANSFTNCRAIQDDGGALGTITGTTTVDTHMMKSMEWGAAAILSQSKYGYYDRGTSTNIQVWNNPNSSYITGSAGTSKDLGSTVHASCYTYNTDQGIKTSTTGNIYGIYDMAGGAWEQVAGVYGNANTLGTSIEAKHYDLYTNPGNTYTNYDGGKIGDMTRELSPTSQVSWNSDFAHFVYSTYPLFSRGGGNEYAAAAGVFVFGVSTGDGYANISFRPALAVL